MATIGGRRDLPTVRSSRCRVRSPGTRSSALVPASSPLERMGHVSDGDSSDGSILADNPAISSSATVPCVASRYREQLGRRVWKSPGGYWFALSSVAQPRRCCQAAPLDKAVLAERHVVRLGFHRIGEWESSVALDVVRRLWQRGPEKTIVTARNRHPRSLLWNPLPAAGLVYVDAPTGLGVFPTDTRVRRLSASGATLTDTGSRDLGGSPGTIYPPM